MSKSTVCAMGLLVFAMAGCASVGPVGSDGNQLADVAPENEINWPTGYLPEKATFAVRNEIDINAPPEVIWRLLIDAEDWTDWYDGASSFQMRRPESGPLGPDAEFEWKTMGFHFVSVIHEFDPPQRLAWESRRGSLKGYHAWLIEPTKQGSKVITAETQYGTLATLQKVFQPNKLHRLHDHWLDRLKTLAESSATE